MPELDITWMLPDGRVGGRGPDGTVSLTGGLPGDRVEYEETGRQGRTLLGRVTQVLTPSADRVPPTCAWASTCGGCDLAELSLGAQRQHKARVIQFAMRMDAPPPLLTPQPSTAYRGRIKLRFSKGHVGYHQASSHILVDAEQCAVSHPAIQVAHAQLRDWVAEHGHTGLSDVEL
ncbi:MAG: hypothetical protein AB8H79_12185, partial [Myxococcota bacterium]